MLHAVTSYYHPTSSPEVLRLVFTKLLCIEHVDHTQVPTNKSVLLRMYIYKMQQHAYAPECDRLLNLSPHPVPDANYYVFGLRKIII